MVEFGAKIGFVSRPSIPIEGTVTMTRDTQASNEAPIESAVLQRDDAIRKAREDDVAFLEVRQSLVDEVKITRDIESDFPIFYAKRREIERERALGNGFRTRLSRFYTKIHVGERQKLAF